MVNFDQLFLPSPLHICIMNVKATTSFWVVLLLFCLSCQEREQRMRISSWVSSPEETKIFETTLNAFRKAQPDVDFDFEPIPGNYSEKLQLMLGTRTAPDLFFMKGYLAPSYMSFGILEPLDERIASASDLDLQDFYPSLLQSFQREGKQFGLPKDFAPYVMFYNEEMLREAGLDSVPTTWSELEAYAKKLTIDKDGDGKIDQYGLVIEPSTEMLMPFVFQNQGNFQNPDGSLGITDKPFIEAMEFYHGLYKKGYATIPTDVGQGWNGDTFGRGMAAMCFSGGWLIPFLKGSYSDLNWKVAEMPAGKQKGTVAFTTAFAMPKDSKYKEDAWQMMNYLTGKEGMEIWTSGGIAMPSRRSVAVRNGFYEDPVYGVFMNSAEYARTFQVEFSERGFEEMVVAMQAVFFTGKEPREAMEDIKTRIEKYSLK